jgi:Flp pilus assembly protein TadG
LTIFRTLRRFEQDQRGVVGVFFALLLIPMLGMTGVAIDYSRASNVRIALQSAADATSLALAKDSLSSTTSQFNAHARTVFNANWSRPFNAELETLTVSKQPDRFRVDARARVNNTLLPLLGIANTEVSASSTSGWGVNKIEIALVLDNTGSMSSSSKMQELKKALCGVQDCSNPNPTSGFVRMMKDAAIDDNQIRVSLVPFDTSVRVPVSVQNAVTSGSVMNDTFVASGSGYCGSNPTTARRINWSLTGAPSGSWFRFADRDKDTISSDTNDSGTFVGPGCGSGRITPSTWRGCVSDRDMIDNRDTRASGVDTSAVATLYPAVTCRSNNLARIASLVDVRTQSSSLIASLANMQPSGNTNLTIGVSWGTNMLTHGMPMSNAIAPVPNLQRFMILLTDGENTENRFTDIASAIDARALAACNNAKAQGIKIYAVRVIEGNKNLLQSCASGPNFYYEVTNAAQIHEVFSAIAGSIGSIRITN